MTETPSSPEPTPAETPTAPLPPIDVPPAVETTAPIPAPAPDAWPVPGDPPIGLHAPRRASEGAIAAMVIGSLLFAMLAFGAGWTARGIAQRVQLAHGGAMMSQQFGGGQGFSGRPGAQGFGQGYSRESRRGFGQRGRMGLTPNGQAPSMPGQPQNQPQTVPATPTP
jgi:hypothetical protein